MVYTTGPYNKMNETEQWIRITDGCPNQCEYCKALPELNYYGIPEIIKDKIRIMDMNLLQVDKEDIILKELSERKEKFELICGVDYRVLTQERAELLFKGNFGRFNKKGKWYKGIRIAWDRELEKQYQIKDKIDLLKKAGFKPKQIEVFVICDWKIPFEICLLKLFLLKIWGVLINDCWFDNVQLPNYQMNFWSMKQCKTFRGLCAVHNQSILFGIFPDMKRAIRAVRELI